MTRCNWNDQPRILLHACINSSHVLDTLTQYTLFVRLQVDTWLACSLIDHRMVTVQISLGVFEGVLVQIQSNNKPLVQF